MTDEERRAPENGVWLCANCATEIDKDPARYPVSLLRQWKSDAEDEALKRLEYPSYRNLQQQVVQLANFLTQAQQLSSRLNEIPLPIGEHNTWVDQVEEYLRENLGQDFEVRFSDFSGMVFYGDGSEKSKMSRSLNGRSRRLHEFIRDLRK